MYVPFERHVYWHVSHGYHERYSIYSLDSKIG